MPVALRIALRELSGGLKGFWIYLACLAIGVAAIASAGSVTEGFNRGLTAQARTILGGDALFTTSQRQPNTEEQAYVSNLGTVSNLAITDVMGDVGGVRQLVDIRAVDGAFPLLGDVVLSGGETDFQTAISKRGERWGAVVSATFLDTFKVSVGDTVRLGPVDTVITAQLDAVPYRLGRPGVLRPEAVISLDALTAADYLQDGQIFRYQSRVILNDGQTYADLRDGFREQFKNTGFRMRGPNSAVNGLRRLLGLLNSFLAIIGIAALIAGGVGVSQATNAFLESRTGSIAALKALGASSKTVRNAYVIQLGSLALLGAAAGAVIGALSPFLLNIFAGEKIPLPQVVGFFPKPVFIAIGLGLLAAALFAVPAIGRARATKPAALFRTLSDRDRAKTPWIERIWAGVAGLLLIALAVMTSSRPGLTFILMIGAFGAWIIFWIVAIVLKFLARRASRLTAGYRRVMLTNLGGPGSLATTIVPALGLGITLLTLVSAVQANLLREIEATLPDNIPPLIFNQIPADGVDQFDTVMSDYVDIQNPEVFQRTPFILGRFVKIRDVAIDRDAIANEVRWATRGEITLTYTATPPPDTEMVEGAWWPADYSGDLRVSVEKSIADALKVSVNDTLGFRIAGRELTATITSLHSAEFGGFNISANLPFLFSPGVLEGLKPYHAAIAKPERSAEQTVINAVGAVLPDVIIYQTGSLIDAATNIFSSVALAVKAAASIVILAGLLVLFGAFAAMARKRRHESALLKTFGAKRKNVLSLYAGEFGLAGAAGALVGIAIGVLTAWPIVHFVFDASWVWPWRDIGIIVLAAIVVSAIGGLLVGLSTLKQPPLRVLRSA